MRRLGPFTMCWVSALALGQGVPPPFIIVVIFVIVVIVVIFIIFASLKLAKADYLCVCV